MTDVVVVESPAKAKTINKYLGSGFTVLASFGHVRDLPPKDGSVRPDEDFAMDWAADERGQQHRPGSENVGSNCQHSRFVQCHVVRSLSQGLDKGASSTR